MKKANQKLDFRSKSRSNFVEKIHSEIVKRNQKKPYNFILTLFENNDDLREGIGPNSMIEFKP
jgi:hypothetical protein